MSRRGNIFQSSQEVRRPSNAFNLSHDLKTSFKLGQLIPTLVLETLPGDKFTISVESLTKFMPLVSPAMQKFNITHHLFFVPNRLVWDDWDDFIGGNGSFTTPVLNGLSGLQVGDLGEYMGLPLSMDADEEISAIPFAGYSLIYDEYYSDNRLYTDSFQPLAEGTSGANSTYESYALGVPFIRAWAHDYFTSCLPYPQEGSSSVAVPTTGSGTDPYVRLLNTSSDQKLENSSGTPLTSGTLTTDASGQLQVGGVDAWLDPQYSLQANIANDKSDISDLRRAIKLQEFLEKDGRGGFRYTETIYKHFGVRSKDARLDRPEYIGGSKGNIAVSEVLSSAETREFDSDDIISPIGSFAGHGVGVTGGNTFKYYSEEWGTIICITSVLPDASYSQGIHKLWSRTDRLDWYWHEFANIGEQAVKVREIFAEGTVSQNDEDFGYIPRYSEYKFLQNRITGLMKTDLDHWHLGRQFASKPTLNDALIQCIPDTRIFADETGHQIVAHIYFNIQAYRQMPMFANPSI